MFKTNQYKNVLISDVKNVQDACIDQKLNQYNYCPFIGVTACPFMKTLLFT